MLKLVISTLLVSLASAYEVPVNRTKKINIIQVDDKEFFDEQYGEYTATLYLGTPPQKISNVVMDTGSYMPWVKVNGWCTQESCPGVAPTYHPKKSSTFTYIQEQKSIGYGSGSAVGFPVNDAFCIIASQPDSCFKNAPLQFYGMGETTSGFTDFQGLIGLGPKSFNGVKSFLSQVVQQNNIESTFSVYYTLNPSMQSTILFGQPNYEKYAIEGSTAEDVQWADIAITPNFNGVQWLTRINQATYGDLPLYNPSVKSVAFQVDTGTTGMKIDPASFQSLLDTAETYGTPCAYDSFYQYYVCTCQLPDCSDHPTLNLTVQKSDNSGETFTISLESYYTLRPIKDYKYRLMFSSVNSNDIGPNMVQWIFGQELFHKFYTIFDVANQRVGYIEQKSLNYSSQDLAEDAVKAMKATPVKPVSLAVLLII